MSSQKVIPLGADDCLTFREEDDSQISAESDLGRAIQHFVTKVSDFEVFHFGNGLEDELPLAHLDLKAGKWRAGRLVGEAYFNYEGQEYKIEIRPRFGNQHLFRMLEEIFNVRLSESQHGYNQSQSKQQLIRKLISFLWLNLLAKGNRHGLPRVSKEKTYRGSKVRGRINVRDSLIPVKTEKKVVSTYRQKSFDEKVVRLLKGAYEILLSDYYLGRIKQPHNAKHALDQLNQLSGLVGRLTEREYQSIKVKRIYKPFKPVIDLSWDIIRNSRDADQHRGTEQTFSYFIDMAEIWEMYLRSLMKKRLSQDGWQLWREDITTYPDKLFHRKLIPDIVFQKEDKYLVFDAKYKLMEYRSHDFDRSDFYQIHTYIQYFNQLSSTSKVLAGGLLYPFSKSFDVTKQQKSLSPSLFGVEMGDTKFLVNGIDLEGHQSEGFDFDVRETEFVNRIKHIVS